MKRKIKYLTTILLFVFLFYTLKTSYSRFSTQVQGEINNNNTNIQFARFVVNNEITDSLSYDISEMIPGDEKEITFTVANYIQNSNQRTQSDVNITYKIKIYSYMLPLEFELYTQASGRVRVPLTCTGYLGLTCQSNEYTQNYSNKNIVSYYLKVKYPASNNQKEFRNGIDNILLEIESWQKTS